MLISKQFKNGVKSVKKYLGAEVASDHNPVVMRLSVKLKARKTLKPTNKTIDISQLRDPAVQKKAADSINEGLGKLSADTTRNTENINEVWSSVKDVVHSAQSKLAGSSNNTK